MADVFDRVADVYDQTVAFFAHFGDGLAAYAGTAGAARVLDLACGRGAVGAAAHARYLPREHAEIATLIDAFTLESAVIELSSALIESPADAQVPMHVLAAVLDAGRKR